MAAEQRRESSTSELAAGEEPAHGFLLRSADFRPVLIFSSVTVTSDALVPFCSMMVFAG